MYHSYFGLTRQAFSAAPDADSCAGVPTMKNAFESLVRCLAQGRGIGIVTAPAGLGKTILCQTLADELADSFATILLPNASFTTRRSFLQTILCELGHPYVRMSEQELRLTLISTVRSLRPQKEGLVLLIDEAHLLSDQLLEEARVLTNLFDNGEPLVRLALSGQLPLEENLAAVSLEALNQRIGCHVSLDPLTRQESADYIAFRLNQAGADPADVFSTEALRLICHASDGVPRCLNQLCDQSLMLGALSEERPVGSDTVRTALEELKQLPLHWNELPAAHSSASNSSASNSSASNSSVESATPQSHAESSIDEMPQEPDSPIDSEQFSNNASGGEDSSTAVFECGNQDDECIEVGSVFEVGDNNSASETFEIGAEANEAEANDTAETCETSDSPVLTTAAEEDPVDLVPAEVALTEVTPAETAPAETTPIEVASTASDAFEEAVVDLYARLDAEYARPDGQITMLPDEPMEREQPVVPSVAAPSVAVAETSSQEESLLTAVLEIGSEAEEALEAGSSASEPTTNAIDSVSTDMAAGIATDPVDETAREAVRPGYDVVYPEPDEASSAITETAENDGLPSQTSNRGATSRRYQRDELICELRRRYRKQA